MTTAFSSFAPTGAVGGVASQPSQALLLPTAGTPTIALVSNLGDIPVYVLMGTSSAVVVTTSTGLPVLPNEKIALTIGSNTYIAILAAFGTPVQVNVGN